jgi:hypothetical protein
LSENFNSQLKCSKSGLVKADSILKSTYGEFIVSKQKLNQAEGISLVKLNREQKTQSLCFASRPFMLCGLPVRALPRGELMYERRNGHFVLQITGHPKFGVPFGQDKILPIFLATLAVRQRPIRDAEGWQPVPQAGLGLQTDFRRHYFLRDGRAPVCRSRRQAGSLQFP